MKRNIIIINKGEKVITDVPYSKNREIKIRRIQI